MPGAIPIWALEMKNLKRFAQNQFGRLWLLLVYLFLYIPLLFLIVFSFNSTRQD